jgi:hypothetical protein
MIDRETLGDHQAGLPLVWRGAVGDDDEGGRTREAGLGENGHTASRVTPGLCLAQTPRPEETPIIRWRDEVAS